MKISIPLAASIPLCQVIYTDWNRYGIKDCKWPKPFPLALYDPCPTSHQWGCYVPTIISWTWDLGPVELLFEGGDTSYRIDGASIPLSLASFCDPVAALIGSFPHDILYETQGGYRKYRVIKSDGITEERVLINNLTQQPLAMDGVYPPSHERRRQRADAVLLAFFVAAGMSFEEAHRAYVIVRAAGQTKWDSTEEKQVCT